jgi:hypothetical protein
MSLEASQKWCMLFAVTNLGLFLYNGSAINLYIGIAMTGWVIFLDYSGRR